jgi:nicotinamide mononucleotide (NMN) deamidase PncC
LSTRAQKLHASRHKGVFYITGGGTGLIEEMMTTPGASRTVLDVRIPYAVKALEEVLGSKPEQACSSRTARAMAMAALQRSLTYSHEPGDVPFGLGCTASLATDRDKKGEHRAHIAIQTVGATWHAYLPLSADRATEEKQLVEALWEGLNHMLTQTHQQPFLRTPAHEDWQGLITGRHAVWATEDHDGKLLFPGSFAPVHHGHMHMMEIAEARLGLTGAFEISIENPDKPLLDYAEIAERLGQFERPAWLTRLPNFEAKATHFPQATFIIGIDTLVRIAAPRYYAGLKGRNRALATLKDHDVRFLVFGREDQGEFMHLEDYDLPQPLLDLCLEVSEEEFRRDVSSSELRGNN